MGLFADQKRKGRSADQYSTHLMSWTGFRRSSFTAVVVASSAISVLQVGSFKSSA